MCATNQTLIRSCYRSLALSNETHCGTLRFDSAITLSAGPEKTDVMAVFLAAVTTVRA